MSRMNEQGTNLDYDVNQEAQPQVFNHTQCGITSSQFFWEGTARAQLSS